MNHKSGTEIVLIGGGHAHVHVMKALAERPVPGGRVTLIARDLMAPYSGMVPGVVAGLYGREQAHIDLVRLAGATGTRLIHATAVGLDRTAKRVVLADAPPVPYDLASIDVGITPDVAAIPGAAQHAIAVKPIGALLDKVEDLRARCRAGTVRRFVMIGGGAGGIEMILALRSRLIADALSDGRQAGNLSFALVTAQDILATHNVRVRATFRRIFAARGVLLWEWARVAAVEAGGVRLANGETIDADFVLMATGAAAPAWLSETGLALADGGFLATAPTLQVINDADVFAAGDCAALVQSPREKAGVYAVRAGVPLADNLRRRALGEQPREWWPQRRHLALISAGERYAVASRGVFKAEGAWVWSMKDRIDRRWMRQFQLPA